MKLDLKIMDKVAICDTKLTKWDEDSLISDFVCYGYVLHVSEEFKDGIKYVTIIRAVGTDGKLYIDEDLPDGIYFQSEEEFLSRLSAEKSLFPEEAKKVDQMILALKTLSVR